MEVAAKISLTERKKSSEKPALKELDMSIFALENRLKCLRMQKQRKEEQVEVTRKKAQSILEKKLNAESLIRSAAETNSSAGSSPREQRKSHQLQMRNIKQAIYLVKLDEARQLKKAKNEHRERMMEMRKERDQEIRVKHESIHQQTKEKRKYYEFMSRKLAEAKRQHLQEYMSAAKAKQNKLKLIEDMQKEEKKLKEELEREEKIVNQANREYVAAFNLPRKEAVKYFKQELRNNSSFRQSKATPTKGQFVTANEQEDSADQLKMPKTTVKNQLKLRLVLSELKRRSLSTIE